MQIERRISNQLCAGEEVIDLGMAALAKMGALIEWHRAASQVCKLVHLAERKNAAKHLETATLIALPWSSALQPFNDAHSQACHGRSSKDKTGNAIPDE